MRKQDVLTYRYPRTLGEAFGCDATDAYALHKHTFRSHMLFRWLVRVTVVGAVMAGVVWAL